MIAILSEDRMNRWSNQQVIMAVLNATPDSFSGDGIYSSYSNGTRLYYSDNNNTDLKTEDNSLESKLVNLCLSNVNIIDIGAESTRPGSNDISADQQISRLKPVFEVFDNISTPIPVLSVDTSNAKVAEFAAQKGIQIINDVTGGSNIDLLYVVAKYKMEIVIVHNSAQKEKVSGCNHFGLSYDARNKHNIVNLVKNQLKILCEQAINVGIHEDKIIIDPGIGFGKSVRDNLLLIECCDQLKELGFPILVGASRKSFIGKILCSQISERSVASLVAHIRAWQQGANIIRTHDVTSHQQALLFWQSMCTARTKCITNESW